MQIKDRVKMIKNNEDMWEEIKNNHSHIKDFLFEQLVCEKIQEVMATSIRLIISELIVNADFYKKYPSHDYKEKDFVDMVMQTVINKNIDIDDDKNIKKMEKHIDKSRKLIWGYIKSHMVDIKILIENIMKKDNSFHIAEDKHIKTIMDCLAVVWMESLLRKIEGILLEKMYGEKNS